MFLEFSILPYLFMKYHISKTDITFKKTSFTFQETDITIHKPVLYFKMMGRYILCILSLKKMRNRKLQKHGRSSVSRYRIKNKIKVPLDKKKKCPFNTR